MGRPRVENAVLLDPVGRRVIAGQFIAQLGFGLGVIALPYLVLHQTGSAALSGLTATAGIVPYVLFGVFAGAIGDRSPRRRLLIGAYVFQTVAAAAVPLWALTGRPPTGLILGVAFLIGLDRSFGDAGVFGAIADIVSPENFIEGQTLLSVIWSSGQIFGPFAGGAIIALVGGSNTVAVEAALFAVGAVVAASISRPLSSPVAGASEPILRAVREGLALMVRVPILRLLTIVATLWFFCVMGTQGLYLAYFTKELHLSIRVVGLTFAAGGGVGLLGSVAVRPLVHRFGGARLIAAGVVGSGLSVLGLAAARGVGSAVVAMACLGFTVQITTASFVAERQRYAPHHLQSRIGLSGRAIVLAAMMAGGFAGSALATVISLRALLVGVGACSLALALWAVPAIFRAVTGVAQESVLEPATQE